MTQNQSSDANRIKSPYADLQAVLPGFRALNPEPAESRPVFDNQAKARLFIDIQAPSEQRRMQIMAVWEIDHADLEASEICGWSVTRRAC